MLVGLYNKKDIVFYNDVATLVVYQNSCDRNESWCVMV